MSQSQIEEYIAGLLITMKSKDMIPNNDTEPLNNDVLDIMCLKNHIWTANRLIRQPFTEKQLMGIKSILSSLFESYIKHPTPHNCSKISTFLRDWLEKGVLKSRLTNVPRVSKLVQVLCAAQELQELCEE